MEQCTAEIKLRGVRNISDKVVAHLQIKRQRGSAVRFIARGLHARNKTEKMSTKMVEKKTEKMSTKMAGKKKKQRKSENA